MTAASGAYVASEMVCPYGTGKPHGVTAHGVEGHRHAHNPLAPACSRGLPDEPTCSQAVCRTCDAPSSSSEEQS